MSFVDQEQYSSVLKEAKEAVETEPQREDMLSRPGTGEMFEEDYIPTVSVNNNCLVLTKKRWEKISTLFTSLWRNFGPLFFILHYFIDV